MAFNELNSVNKTTPVTDSHIAIRELLCMLWRYASLFMKKHSGIRPHEIVFFLKIAAKKETLWIMKDLAKELGISASKISEGLNRAAIAGLIADDKKRLLTPALLDFVVAKK